MCNFFSFIQDSLGDIYYSDVEMRKAYNGDACDSHSFLASYFKKDVDKVNKFEFSNRGFIIDQDNLHIPALIDTARNWILIFSKTDAFHGICLEAVRQDVFDLQHVETQTEQICLEAVKQDGRALKYVKEQTEQICLEAVKQSGFFALMYVKDCDLRNKLSK